MYKAIFLNSEMGVLLKVFAPAEMAVVVDEIFNAAFFF